MLILPAIDIYLGKAVRLLHGNYRQKEIYSDDPLQVAMKMKTEGARALHLVDLEGARSGIPANRELICSIRKESGLFTEVGGGIRNTKTIDYYLDRGIDRVILGSKAVTDPAFLEECLREYGERIAVGVDLLDGKIAIHGWEEFGDNNVQSFFNYLQSISVKTVICTDISRDGALRGTNHELYQELSEKYSINLIASGGVTGIDDIKALKALGIHGAIIGKAYYTGAINLKEALEVAA